MMIAAVRIVKDAGAQNDRGAHAEERDKASQYPEHCKPPQVGFSETFQCRNCKHCGGLLCTACPALAMTFSRITAI
jgi:hypothetical protein